MPLIGNSLRSSRWRKFWRALTRRPRDYVFVWRS